MKARLAECFPDPLTPSWPSTANTVNCEARQVYALSAIACCVPGAHVLILHDQDSNHLRSCMTRGFKYVDLLIESYTSGHEVSQFLHKAQQHTPSGTGLPSMEHPTNSPREKNETKSNRSFMTPSAAASTNLTIQNCVVATIRGAHRASPDVLSVLMDAVSVGQVRLSGENAEEGNTTVSIPDVHIVLFCSHHRYTELLSERFRAGFALSMFVSSLTMDRAPVLRSNNVRNSSIIDKKNLIEVCHASDLLESVRVPPEVASYLRHLLLVLRGSMLPGSTAGSFVVYRSPMYLRILRAAAVLFQPPSDALMVRALSENYALSRRSTFIAPEGDRERVPSFLFHTEESIHKTDLSHVIVSPQDVICLLSSMTAHLFTLPRSHLKYLSPSGHLRQDSSSSISAGGSVGMGGNTKPLRTMMPHSLPNLSVDLDAANDPSSPPDPTFFVDAQNLSQMRQHSGKNFIFLTPSSVFHRDAVKEGEEENEERVEMLSYAEVKTFMRMTIIQYSDPAPG